LHRLLLARPFHSTALSVAIDLFPPVSLFFFYGSADHRDLHSFPTRRSSDLTLVQRDPEQLADHSQWQLKCDSIDQVDWLVERQRSEEHTSELQSLRHLVCRLLLEKKKKN